MSGWCVANLFRLTPQERFCCMLAASLADIDGIGILVSRSLYWDWHHLLGHNLPFAIAISLAMLPLSKHRLKAPLIYLGLAHLHLLMDYFGSGPGWPIYYLWPFSNGKVLNGHAWEFFSWQNITIAAALLAWTIAIAVRKSRTPLEYLMPALDQKLVILARRAILFRSAPTVRAD
jgi:inner membrane protein